MDIRNRFEKRYFDFVGISRALSSENIAKRAMEGLDKLLMDPSVGKHVSEEEIV